MNADRVLKLARCAYPEDKDKELRVAYMLGLDRGYEERENEEDETVTDCNELEEAAEEYAKDETMAGLAERAFKAGANWQKEQDESRKKTNVTLANTEHPKNKQVEIAFEDIWLDAEVSVEAFGAVDTNLTSSMKSLCHDFFEAGTDWQKEQLRDLCYQCEKNGETIYYKGEQHAMKMMKEEAAEGMVDKLTIFGIEDRCEITVVMPKAMLNRLGMIGYGYGLYLTKSGKNR